MTDDQKQAGLVYGLIAFSWWGLMPLYFKALDKLIDHVEMLAQRIVWSAVLLAVILSAIRGWPGVWRCFTDRAILWRLLASTVLIAFNWYIYILGVSTDRIAETSLGYFILPLVNVGLGLTLFGERLRRWQFIALGFGAAGLAVEIVVGGYLPWIALALAVSFALYGLARKTAAVDGLTGLSVETILLSPVALFIMGWQGVQNELAFGRGALWQDFLILASGVITAVPLVCFAQAARRLPLSTIGFLQYLSPTIQLLIGLLIFREPCPPSRVVCFGLIWVGLVIYSVDAYRQFRQAPEATP